MTAKAHIGEEVYVIAFDEFASVGASEEIYFCEDFMEALEHLSTKDESDVGLKALHGVLTTAEVLPNQLKGREAYLILIDPYDEESGMILDESYTTVEDLADGIERVIKNGKSIDIEDIYVIYGYRLTVCLALNTDELDEDTVEVCKEISTEIEQIIAGTIE